MKFFRLLEEIVRQLRILNYVLFAIADTRLSDAQIEELRDEVRRLNGDV